MSRSSGKLSGKEVLVRVVDQVPVVARVDVGRTLAAEIGVIEMSAQVVGIVSWVKTKNRLGFKFSLTSVEMNAL